MKKTKLHKYADAVRKAKAKALAEIANIEARGFHVPQATKDLAMSATPDRIAKSTYQHNLSYFNLNQIRSKSKMRIDTIDKSGKRDNIKPVITDFAYAEYISESRLAKRVNKMLNTKLRVQTKDGIKYKPLVSEDLIGKVISLISSINDKATFPKPGMSTEYYDIDVDYDTKKPLTLLQHLTFKKIPIKKETQDYISWIAQNPYTSEKLYEAYTQDWHEKSFQSNLKSSEIDPQSVETLRWLLNTSKIWNIAQQTAYDSKQVKKNWETLMKRVMEVDEDKKNQTQEDWDELVSMIENEEDYDKILNHLEDMILKKWKDNIEGPQ